MAAAGLSFDQYKRVKTIREITRVQSLGPTFGLHSSSSLERGQVEQYIFDQFLAKFGARVRTFMPLLLTTSYHGQYTAVAGIRPACGNDLYLERYLPVSAEIALGEVAGHRVERKNFVEIGNLAATQRGSSQMLFMILAAVLHRAGFDWLVFTAAPPVQKTIRRMGLELYELGYADPSVLDADSLAGWGSYYECRPAVVAGNLSAAMTVAANRKLYTRLLSIYQNCIDSLALIYRQINLQDGLYSYTI